MYKWKQKSECSCFQEEKEKNPAQIAVQNKRSKGTKKAEAKRRRKEKKRKELRGIRGRRGYKNATRSGLEGIM